MRPSWLQHSLLEGRVGTGQKAKHNQLTHFHEEPSVHLPADRIQFFRFTRFTIILKALASVFCTGPAPVGAQRLSVRVHQSSQNQCVLETCLQLGAKPHPNKHSLVHPAEPFLSWRCQMLATLSGELPLTFFTLSMGINSEQSTFKPYIS